MTGRVLTSVTRNTGCFGHALQVSGTQLLVAWHNPRRSGLGKSKYYISRLLTTQLVSNKCRICPFFAQSQVARARRQQLQALAALAHKATAIQAAWRGDRARKAYRVAHAYSVAAREIQRRYRGHLGRKVSPV